MTGFRIVSDRRFVSELLPTGQTTGEERVRSSPARGIAIGCALGLIVWMLVGLIWLFWF